RRPAGCGAGGNARSCVEMRVRPKTFFTPNLSAWRSDLYDNPFDYNDFREYDISGIYRKTP
ncbi:MAG: hypothetical protein J4F48_07115, partial [Nitrospinae bacterium]|nr:hypothetical protein [Nitrospinota bacterium]